MKTPAQQLSKMISLAAHLHEGVYDKGGIPYFQHVARVAAGVDQTDLELVAIGYGHDLLEDTKLTIADLHDHGFSQRVIDALTLLTHTQGESYEVYIAKIASNPDAIEVKMSDLRDNSNIHRLKGLRPQDFERVEKYHRAYKYLQETKESRKNAWGKR